jgi:hypothetical protein
VVEFTSGYRPGCWDHARKFMPIFDRSNGSVNECRVERYADFGVSKPAPEGAGESLSTERESRTGSSPAAAILPRESVNGCGELGGPLSGQKKGLSRPEEPFLDSAFTAAQDRIRQGARGAGRDGPTRSDPWRPKDAAGENGRDREPILTLGHVVPIRIGKSRQRSEESIARPMNRHRDRRRRERSVGAGRPVASPLERRRNLPVAEVIRRPVLVFQADREASTAGVSLGEEPVPRQPRRHEQDRSKPQQGGHTGR